jgi:hypothetical protein
VVNTPASYSGWVVNTPASFQLSGQHSCLVPVEWSALLPRIRVEKVKFVLYLALSLDTQALFEVVGVLPQNV